MMPSVGPTGYVFPLSHIAEIVRCVGVTRSEVKFHPKVIGCEGAILKKDAAAVCGGCVKVSPPAAAVCGMETVVEEGAEEDWAPDTD